MIPRLVQLQKSIKFKFRDSFPGSGHTVPKDLSAKANTYLDIAQFQRKVFNHFLDYWLNGH